MDSKIEINFIKCRLCKGDAFYKFSEKVLNKLNIKFYECEKCNSLQTEEPYWLDQAYEDWLTKYDTGVFARVDKTSLISLIICKIFKFKNLLDVGGGDGLFCRIMRDYFINCYSQDKFSKNVYAKEFTEPNFKNADLLTSFEVIEHFSHPEKEFDNLFKSNPKMVLLTTVIYNNQDQKWNYLELDSGQHIFFYSKRALKLIGEKYDYDVNFLESGFTLMISKQFEYKKIFLFLLKKIIVREKMFYLLRFIKMFFNSTGYSEDYDYVKNKLKNIEINNKHL